jgi:hypothetical protein
MKTFTRTRLSGADSYLDRQLRPAISPIVIESTLTRASSRSRASIMMRHSALEPLC